MLHFQIAVVASLSYGLALATPINETLTERGVIQRRAVCNAFGSPAGLGATVNCMNYLYSLGTQQCVVDKSKGYPPKFCHMGTAVAGSYIYGTTTSQYASSYW